MLTLWVGVAIAATPDCNALDRAVFARGLDQVDAAFAASEPLRARALLEVIHQRAPCLVEPAAAGAMARYAVLRAVAASMDQDQAWMERWVRAALWADPHHGWPAYVGPTHPVRAVEVDPATLRPVGPAGEGLQPPPGGGMLLSGVLIERPRVPPEVPVLRQVFDDEGRVVDAEWQDGAAFPDTWLAAGAPDAPEPVWWSGDPSAAPVGGPRWAWGTVVAVAGGGLSSQEVDDPGTFLSDGSRGGPLIGLATSGAVVPQHVGAAWDLRASPADGWGQLSALGSLAIGAGAVAGVVGGGVVTTPVVEGGDVRVVWVPMPHVGAVSRLEVGTPWLELGAGGGWMPAATHLSGHASLAGGPGLSWSVGLDGGLLTTHLEQPDSGRELSVTRVRAGVRVGAVLGR